MVLLYWYFQSFYLHFEIRLSLSFNYKLAFYKLILEKLKKIKAFFTLLKSGKLEPFGFKGRIYIHPVLNNFHIL